MLGSQHYSDATVLAVLCMSLLRDQAYTALLPLSSEFLKDRHALLGSGSGSGSGSGRGISLRRFAWETDEAKLEALEQLEQAATSLADQSEALSDDDHYWNAYSIVGENKPMRNQNFMQEAASNDNEADYWDSY
eukprot:jgi/Hompol1/6677/HPOL_000134-RA